MNLTHLKLIERFIEGVRTLSPDVASLGKNRKASLPRKESKPRAANRGHKTGDNVTRFERGNSRASEKARADQGDNITLKRGSRPELAERFEEFWRVYPRHDAEEPARKAFARAIEDTDPEIIVAGAQRYAVAEECGSRVLVRLRNTR